MQVLLLLRADGWPLAMLLEDATLCQQTSGAPKPLASHFKALELELNCCCGADALLYRDWPACFWRPSETQS